MTDSVVSFNRLSCFALIIILSHYNLKVIFIITIPQKSYISNYVELYMSYYSSKIKTIFMPYELHLKVNPTQVHVEGSLEPLSKKNFI